MGRRAKYLTREDKARGERERRIIRSAAPGQDVKRRAESRRSYHKKKVLQEAMRHRTGGPESVLSFASISMSGPDHHWLFCQFREGRTTWEFGAVEMEENDWELLTGLPPYPESIANADGFLEDWESIEAAIHGFLVRRHLGQCEELRNTARQHRRFETVDALLERNKQLTIEFDHISQAYENYSRTGRWGEADVAFQNKKWRARLLMYNVRELEALGRGIDILIHTLSETMWDLGRS
ncbi:hypothetical protein NMY22_g14192 [Coprinellus aureogranulatus]|nr:hypothetical protein NMY22_g14192 [Coprinellus aureogranulatus]